MACLTDTFAWYIVDAPANGISEAGFYLGALASNRRSKVQTAVYPSSRQVRKVYVKMVNVIERVEETGRQIRVCRNKVTRENRAFLVNVEREMALSRLLKLLEAEAQVNPQRAADARASSMSRIARLQSARATYALATSTEMERVSNGAWIRRRYAR